MAVTLTIHANGPIASARVVEAPAEASGDGRPGFEGGDRRPEARGPATAGQNVEIERLCRTLSNVVSQINGLYERTLAEHREGIAGLAVEIARMILAQKVRDGDYRIEDIIKQALDKAPAAPEITVHLHPNDFAQCQKLQEEDPDGPLSNLTLVSDSGLGRAECIVATPKGSVRAMIERQLERIKEALGKVQ